MARERASVLTSAEVEALSHAFDSVPAAYALQHRFRLKSLVKIGSFASAIVFLSYGEMTPHDTQLVLRDLQAQAEPTWVTLQRLPLTVTADGLWPVPDLIMPTLALASLPLTIPPVQPKSLSQTTIIRAGDNPSSGDLTRQGPIRSAGSTQGGTPASGSTGTTSSPKPVVKTATNNPLATLVSTIISGFNQSAPSQTLGGLSNKTLQSVTSRSTMSGFSGSNFGSKSFGGPSFSGLKKG